MKRTLLCFLSILAITASAQQTPVNADVYTVKEGNASILSGSTRFLETLEINSITLATNSTAKGHQRHDDLEELVIVKSGTLTVAQNNNAQTLGPGSVALTMPGDKHTLINTSKAPVTFYVLTYRSNEKFNTPRGQKSGGSFMLDRETITLHSSHTTKAASGGTSIAPHRCSHEWKCTSPPLTQALAVTTPTPIRPTKSSS